MESAFTEARVPAGLRRVKDGVELLQYLRREGSFQSAAPPQLILLDLNMPRQDGREALQEMKSDGRLRRLPVVVLSTSRSAEDVARLYELGASSYISKPVGFRELKYVMLMIGQYWFRTAELPAAPLPTPQANHHGVTEKKKSSQNHHN